MMTDKMPTNIWAFKRGWEDNEIISTKTEQYGGSLEYTLKHNNPDYHVIKKSDVDGDAIRAFQRILDEQVGNDGLTVEDYLHQVDVCEVRNAIIAQSNYRNAVETELDDAFLEPTTGDAKNDVRKLTGHYYDLGLHDAKSDHDIVRIPRKVLEGMFKSTAFFVTVAECKAYNQAINNVLNYKEGDDEC